MNEKVAMDKQNKSGSQIITDRKMKEMEENEKRLLAEIERIKNQRESELQEIRSQEKEKDNLKQKLKDKDEKYRDLERKKQHQLYELEK